MILSEPLSKGALLLLASIIKTVSNYLSALSEAIKPGQILHEPRPDTASTTPTPPFTNTDSTNH